MRVHEFRIPTKHCMWTVTIDHGLVSYYSQSKKDGWPFLRLHGDSFDMRGVPKSIRRRANVFLKDPDRFGVVKFHPYD